MEPSGGIRLRWFKQEHTFVLTWGERGIIVGLTGRDRPSIEWRLRLWWGRRGL